MAVSIMLFIRGNQYFSLNSCLVFVLPKCPRLCPSLTTCLCSAAGSIMRCSLKINPSAIDSSCLTCKYGSMSLSRLCFSQSPFTILFASHCITSSFWVSCLIRVMTTACSAFMVHLTIFSVLSSPVSGSGCLER